MRASLEVPDGTTGSPAADKHNPTAVEQNNHIPEPAMPEAQEPAQNGSAEQSQSHAGEGINGDGADKRESLTRGARFPARRTGTAGSLNQNRSSAGSGVLGGRSSLEGERPVGVQLIDKPMDD